MKEILHLPSCTSTDWIHAKDGLGLIELQSMVMIARKKASEEMLKSHGNVTYLVQTIQLKQHSLDIYVASTKLESVNINIPAVIPVTVQLVAWVN